jgi:hypothetical protein
VIEVRRKLSVLIKDMRLRVKGKRASGVGGNYVHLDLTGGLGIIPCVVGRRRVAVGLVGDRHEYLTFGGGSVAHIL